MYKAIISLLLYLCAGWASAATCPDFFRFVDFGQQGNDGVLYRGGSIFRAESFSGDRLLKSGTTECLPVEDTAKDGFGNPVPVVAGIHYQPEMTAINLMALHVLTVDNATSVAEENAESHRARLEQADAVVTRGSDFLCASVADTGNKQIDNTKPVNDNQSFNVPGSISCQVVSPYAENIALVIYCDTTLCKMPVMAINEQIIVKASWMRVSDSVSDDSEGSGIADMAGKIHDFLSPLTSLNPG